MFALLVEFNRQHGHCKVPRQYSESPGLGRWVNTQRSRKQSGQLDASKAERLESIGFIWKANSDTWERMFTELEQYKATHGHCNLPTNEPEFRTLVNWVKQQRVVWIAIQKGERKSRSQTLVQIKRLQDLGFDFGSASSQEDRWEENFAALQSYKTKYGDCNVSYKSEEYSQLAKGVNNQRSQLKTGKLLEQWRLRLNEIGFIGDLHEHNWQKMFNELEKYKQEFGNCNIPAVWPQNPRLARWVTSQRAAKKSGKMPPHRVQLLDELGFIWQKYSKDQ